ncbi:MAG: lipid-A-disaccharide synthase [Bacteroidota bacterium]
MKIFLIAGEDSGDLHGSNLIKALQKQVPDPELRGVGGDKLTEVGMELIAHIRDINFMGFLEVLQNLGTIRRLFRTVKTDIEAWQPDLVILIDYPGFNMRMLPFLSKLKLPIFWYISPQVWAWKKGRVKTLRKYVDRMAVILPFEQDFFAKEGMEVSFVGHPLLDALPARDESYIAGRTVALLPGSRKQEIKRMLPVMLEMVERFPEHHFVIAGAPSQTEAFYREMIGKIDVELRMNQTYEILGDADYALVTSGTATLETALFGVPQVICYRGNAVSYAIGKRLVKVKYIGLPNLILDQPLLKELIQYEYNATNLAEELLALMKADRQVAVQSGYEALREKLGSSGASERVAKEVLGLMEGNTPNAPFEEGWQGSA